MCFFRALKLILIKGVIKTHLNSIPMITLDHSGESYVLTFHISYIEDIEYFKFGGGVLCVALFENFSGLNFPVLVFSFNFLCVLISFICFHFLGYIYIYIYIYILVFFCLSLF